MWSAKTRKETGPNGNRQVALVFESDSGYASITDIYSVTPELTTDFLAERAKVRIEELNALDAVFEAVEVGVIVGKDPEPPSKEDLDKKQFQADYKLLQHLLAGVQDGVLKPDDQILIDLQTKVKTEFKPEYGDLLN